VVRCRRLRRTGRTDELATRLVLRSLARRAEAATSEADELEREILAHVRVLAPTLVDEGDRQLNSALHTVILHRRQHDPATRDYIARRITEGKSTRDGIRLLKRHLARHLYRLLQQQPLMA
jgi:hypothetical protein